ncbi:uncharacterized protein KNAG_0A01500 [Huiozyma naganishii CBS 8797]|uniref:Uncharacterized protein n=1 Tax=Huiozyma naganishii (strain ATCC MYA-139 / BCRC 22969 / CBS 8797 / KCTC 17520 / NBRC 10181 / NCYC 3082 / Yp74L-3) TaxID=1071383 RepID=J7S1V0_HUIN7|nr:hypothetical protein KNAG_0A01500 [Kazachstania naganishii CBS 8797]CCK67839.1 hypothetical protein KNAG_0A01500 [Kazachstania naganishii CBS 8797]
MARQQRAQTEKLVKIFMNRDLSLWTTFFFFFLFFANLSPEPLLLPKDSIDRFLGCSSGLTIGLTFIFFFFELFGFTAVFSAALGTRFLLFLLFLGGSSSSSDSCSDSCSDSSSVSSTLDPLDVCSTVEASVSSSGSSLARLFTLFFAAFTIKIAPKLRHRLPTP